MPSRIIFITGTDTGVGKTVLTALLLAWGLAEKKNILAMKPFCSGGRDDLELLSGVQQGRMPEELLNPFYFAEPVAPLASQRLHQTQVTLKEATRAVKEASKSCEVLLVEGSGGLLVPLGKGYTVLDLLQSLRAEVVVASRNRLGTINHTLLTASALRTAGIRRFKTVLIDPIRRDESSRTNASLLREGLAPNPVYGLPHLKGDLSSPGTIHRHALALGPVLGQVLAWPVEK